MSPFVVAISLFYLTKEPLNHGTFKYDNESLNEHMKSKVSLNMSPLTSRISEMWCECDLELGSLNFNIPNTD